MKKLLLLLLTSISLSGYAQAPTLGTTAGYVLFTSTGAVSNTGISHLTGNFGSNSGAVTILRNVDGIRNSDTATASADLLIANGQLNDLVGNVFPVNPVLGNGDVLTPGIYDYGSGVATSLNGILTLDAQNNPDAVFIFKMDFTFASSTNSQVVLINGALACNVFWKIKGAVGLGDNTIFKGTIVSNAAITLNSGVNLEGRALSTVGQIAITNTTARKPIGCGSPKLTGPVAPTLASTALYALFSSSGNVTETGTGTSTVTGDIGTNLGVTSGFLAGNVQGTIHPNPDASTAQCKNDLIPVYNSLNALPYDIELLYPAQFGNDLVLTPHTYLLGAATTLTNRVYLNAQGNADAVFVFQITGAFSTSTFSEVVLMNGAQAKNVYWTVVGAIDIFDNSVFKGSMITNGGAVSLRLGTSINGRVLTALGALTANAINAVIPANAIWTGTTSSSWNTASNWSNNSVPGLTDDVLINTSSPNAPILDVDYTLPVGKTLDINETGSLTIAPTKAITIAGNANFGGKSVTIKSDATGTGIIGQVTGTLTNANAVTVERFIPSGKRAFRFLTPGVTTTNFISNNWQLATHITGSTTGANGFDQTTTGNPSMYTYNNQVATGTGWTAIANTNATNLTAGMGYRLLIRGDRSVDINSASLPNMNVPVTLSATGTLKSGTVTINATSTPGINNTLNATTNGYSLVGNPYVSPIDWHLVTKSGLDDTYYAWDANMGTVAQRGRYVAYTQSTQVTSIPASQVNRYIQPGQAFFVLNTAVGTPGTLTFSESNKANIFRNVFRNAEDASVYAKLNMTIYEPNELAIGGYAIDGAVAVFGADFDNAIGLGDVQKLEAAGENLALFSNNQKLAIEAKATVVNNDEVVLKTLRFGANKTYTFKINAENFEANITAFLKDNYLNTQTAIDLTQDNFAEFSTTTDAASYGEDRFKIVFVDTALGTDTFAKSNYVVFPNPIANNQFTVAMPANSTGEVKVKLYNLIGQEIYNMNTTAKTNIEVKPTMTLSAGIYILSIENNGTKATQKITVK